MEIIRIDPAIGESVALTTPSLAPRKPTATVDPKVSEPAGSDFFAAARASFMRETTLGALIDAARQDMPEDGVDDYNPWSHIKTLDAGRKAEAERLAGQYPGLFDHARSAAQVDWTIKKALEEEAREKEMGRSFLGMMAGALLDPLALVPVAGSLGAASRLARAGSFAAQLSAQTALTEALLHTNQLTRTKVESLAAAGFSAALGGALGAATARMVPKALEELRTPPKLVVETALGDAEEIAPGSLSAAAVERRGLDAELTRTKDTEKVGGGNPVSRWIANRTPLGRALNASSPVARTVMLRMVDAAGILTKGNVDGVATAAGGTAEDLKLIMQSWSDNLFLDGERTLEDVQKSLGGLGKSKVSNETFHGATQRILLGVFDDADREALAAKFGRDGASVIEQGASKWAEGVHALNDRFEAKLVEFGVVRDVAAFKRHVSDVKKAKKGLEDLAVKKTEAQKALDEKRKEIKAAPADQDLTAAHVAEAKLADQVDEIDAQIKRLNEDRHAAIVRRDAEAAKPEPLGRNYGHAQLWNRQEILARTEEFRDFLIRILVKEPDADWLASAHNLTPEDLKALRVSDEARFREVMREWAGDERMFEINQLETKLAAANARVGALETDLRSILRDLGETDAALSSSVRAEAAAKAKAMSAQVADTAQRIATEKAELRVILAGEEVIERTRALDEAVPARPRTAAEDMRPGSSALEDLKAVLSRAEEDGRQSFPALKAERDAANASVRRAQKELADAQAALVEAQRKGRDAQGRLEMHRDTVAKAESDLLRIEERLKGDMDAKARKDLEALAATMRADAEKSRKAIPVLEASVRVHLKSVRAAEVRVGEATVKLGQDRESVVAASRGLKALTDKLADLRNQVKAAEKAPAPFVDAPGAPRARGVDLPRERKIAKARERMAQLEREEARLAQTQSRLDALHEKIRVAQEAQADKKALRGNLKAIRDIVAEDLKAASKGRNAINRALSKADKRPAMYDTVDQIIENLSSGKNPPMMDRIVPETSSRMKARRIILDAAGKNEALASRWLRTDLPNILALQYDQLAGHLGMREAFNIRKGGSFESIADVRRLIEEDYDKLKNASDPKKRPGLENERTRIVKDFDAMYRRLVGATDPGIDRDGVGYWLTRKAREMTYFKYGVGFGLSSLPDIAAYSLYNRGAMRALFTAAPEWWRIIRGVSTSDLQGMVAATEIGMRAALTVHKTGAMDELSVRGVGAPGSAMHRVTAAVDSVTQPLTALTAKVSGLPTWTRFLKITTGVYTGIRIRDNVAKFSKLYKIERAELASLGIGENEARAIDSMMAKHAAVDDAGRPLWNIDEWENTRARRAFEVAINRNMRRASITPGIADRPVMMDNAFGALWLQLQTFAFSFMNRYLTPMSQRALHLGDYGNVSASLGILLSVTALVVGIRDAIGGKNPAQRYEGVTEDPRKAFAVTRELVDRSGMMTYLAPYVSSMAKLTNVDNSASRFQRMNWVEPLFGVQAGNVGDISRLGRAMADGDARKSAEAAARVAPFSLAIRGIVNNLPD